MENINKMANWKYNRLRESMNLIPDAFRGRKNEEEIALLIASLLYLRKINSLRVVKVEDIDEQKEYIILKDYVVRGSFIDTDGIIHRIKEGSCVCCGNFVFDEIVDESFKLLLRKTLDEFKIACEVSFVKPFIKDLNSLEFQDGELLVLFDEIIKELYSLKREVITQPKELSQLVAFLVEKKVKNIFDPFGGLMDFAVTMPDKSFVAYEINDATRKLALFRMALAGINNHTILYKKSAEYWTKEKYDAIVTFPPLAYQLDMRDYNVSKKIDVDQAIIEHFDWTTNEHGQLVIVVPLSTLFKETMEMKNCREACTKNNWLDTIVVLPNNILESSQIGTAILVLKKDRKKDERIRLVDASECYSKENGRNIIEIQKVIGLIEQTDGVHSIDVTIDEILGENSSWLVGWYLYQHNTEYRAGYEVCHFSDVFATVPSTNQYDEKFGYVVTSDAFTRSSLLHFEFKLEDFAKTDDLRNARKITEPVLLVHCPGTSFPIYCEASEDNPLFLKSPTTWAYTIKRSDVNIGYLCVELFHRSMVLNRYISLFSNRRFFELMQLSFPSLSEQDYLYEDMRRTSQEAKMRELGLQDVIDDYKKQLRARKHAISQNLSAFSALWNTLYRFKTKNGGQLNNSDVVSVSYNRTVADIFEALNERLNVILLQADHLADDEPDWGEPEEIEPTAFIEEYIKTHSDIRFEFIRGYDVEDYYGIVEAFGIECFPKIVFPKKALVRIFENIISNAVSHGFTDAERKDYRILITRDMDIDSMTITISNNGNAILGDFNLIKTFDYGYTTKSSEGHSGLGAHQVKELMSRFHGSVEIVSTPDKSYTVTYILTFKKIT